MRILKPYGPYRIPYEKGKKAKKVTSACGGRFWAKHPKLKRRKGCYIFGIRAGKGIKPAYVGKATKSFGKEIFTVDKLHKYQLCLADHGFGAPIVFFVALPKRKGPAKASLIAKVEGTDRRRQETEQEADEQAERKGAIVVHQRRDSAPGRQAAGSWRRTSALPWLRRCLTYRSTRRSAFLACGSVGCPRVNVSVGHP